MTALGAVGVCLPASVRLSACGVYMAMAVTLRAQLFLFKPQNIQLKGACEHTLGCSGRVTHECDAGTTRGGLDRAAMSGQGGPSDKRDPRTQNVPPPHNLPSLQLGLNFD